MTKRCAGALTPNQMLVVAIAPSEAAWSTVAQTLNPGSAGGVDGWGKRLNCMATQ